MDGNSHFQNLPDYAARLIRFKARKLVGHYGYGRSDQDDIQQDLSTFLWQRLGRFDPDKGDLKPFIDHVVKKGIASLIERRLAAKRDYRREESSLNDPVRDVDGNETQRAALMDENEGARRLGRGHVHFTDRADLAAVLAEIRSRLPDELRPLWDELKTASPTEAARRLGIARGTLYERKKLLRRCCEDAGLEEYL